MTKVQTELAKALAEGDMLTRSKWSTWHLQDGRRFRWATVEALRNAGMLKPVQVVRRCLQSYNYAASPRCVEMFAAAEARP